MEREDTRTRKKPNGHGALWRRLVKSDCRSGTRYLGADLLEGMRRALETCDYCCSQVRRDKKKTTKERLLRHLSLDALWKR